MLRFVLFTLLFAWIVRDTDQAPFDIFGKNPAGLFEGDLLLNSNQQRVVKEAVKSGRTIDETEVSTFGASSTAFKRWTNAIVPYTIHSSLSSNTYAINAIRSGMREWVAKTCIRFKQRTVETNYLEFFRSNGCWGQVGMGNGKTQISVGAGCEHRHVMTHEIGHALGFWHEQSRTDRDSYIQILWQNVPRSLYEAFAKYGSDKIDSVGVPYDYGSIMHYPWNAFSTNGRDTVRPLRTVVRQPYRVLSDLDAKQAKIMYKCSGVVKTTKSPIKPTTPCQPVAPSSCFDSATLCPSWANRGECSRNPGFMLVYCKKSCGRCRQASTCFDRSTGCSGWERSGECQRNPRYMLVYCKKSCKVCSTVTKCKTNPPVVTKAPVQTKPKPKTPPLVISVGKRTQRVSTVAPPLSKTTGRSTTGAKPKLVSTKPITAKPQVTTKLPATTKPAFTGSQGGCHIPTPVGLENFIIPNARLTASSSYNHWHGPQEARLNYVAGWSGIGAWCPATNDKNQYIQVDLGKKMNLLEVATQGRPGKSLKFVRRYYISTSLDGTTFTEYKSSPKDVTRKEFTANSDADTAVSNVLGRVIAARYVRLHPTDWHSGICLRMELYVCSK